MSTLVRNSVGISICTTAETETWTVNVNEGREDKQNALKCSLASFLCRFREVMDCPLQKLFRAVNEALPR